MSRPYQMSRAAERDLAYRIACQPLPRPAPLPTGVELSVEHGREPSALQVERRECETVRPGCEVCEDTGFFVLDGHEVECLHAQRAS